MTNAIYQIRDSFELRPDNSRTFHIRRDEDVDLDGDTQDLSSVLLVINNWKVAVWKGRYYRISQLGIWEDDQDNPFIKVWETDPFAGYEDYEALPEPEGPEYVI